MNITEAKRIFEAIPAELKSILIKSHSRYMHFAGMYSDEFSKEQIAADRAQFSNLLKFTEDGRPSLSDERAAEFMVAVTGLNREWCLATDEILFIHEHGEDAYSKYFEK